MHPLTNGIKIINCKLKVSIYRPPRCVLVHVASSLPIAPSHVFYLPLFSAILPVSSGSRKTAQAAKMLSVTINLITSLEHHHETCRRVIRVQHRTAWASNEFKTNLAFLSASETFKYWQCNYVSISISQNPLATVLPLTLIIYVETWDITRCCFSKNLFNFVISTYCRTPSDIRHEPKKLIAKLTKGCHKLY